MRRTATLTANIAGVSPRRNLRSRLTGRRTARRQRLTVAAAAGLAVLLIALAGLGLLSSGALLHRRSR